MKKKKTNEIIIENEGRWRVRTKKWNENGNLKKRNKNGNPKPDLKSK